MKPEKEKLNDFCDMNKFERLIFTRQFYGLHPPVLWAYPLLQLMSF